MREDRSTHSKCERRSPRRHHVCRGRASASMVLHNPGATRRHAYCVVRDLDGLRTAG